MQVSKSRNEPAAGDLQTGESSGQRLVDDDTPLPRSAVRAVHGELARCDDVEDTAAASHRSATDGTLSRQPGWSATAGRSLPVVSDNTVQSQKGSSDDQAGTNLPDELPKSGVRTTWGHVECPTITPQHLIVVDSNASSTASESAEISAEKLSVPPDGRESSQSVDRSFTQVFPSEFVDSRSDTSVSLPNGTLKSTENTRLSRGGGDDKRPAYAEDESHEEVGVSGGMPPEPLLPSNGDKYTEHLCESVSQEFTEGEEHRLVCSVDYQHASADTVSAVERHSSKPVPDQPIGSETTLRSDRTHLRPSSSSSATTETRERPDRVSVKPVEGLHASVETVAEDADKPCVRMHTERYVSKESESSLPVCLVSVSSSYTITPPPP